MFIFKKALEENEHSNFTWFLFDTKFPQAAKCQTPWGQTTERTWERVQLAEEFQCEQAHDDTRERHYHLASVTNYTSDLGEIFWVIQLNRTLYTRYCLKSSNKERNTKMTRIDILTPSSISKRP